MTTTMTSPTREAIDAEYRRRHLFPLPPVTHGGLCRTYCGLWLNPKRLKRVWRFTTDNCSSCVYEASQ